MKHFTAAVRRQHHSRNGENYKMAERNKQNSYHGSIENENIIEMNERSGLRGMSRKATRKIIEPGTKKSWKVEIFSWDTCQKVARASMKILCRYRRMTIIKKKMITAHRRDV